MKDYLVLLILLFCGEINGRVWQCQQSTGLCKSILEDNSNTNVYPSLESCNLVCGDYGGPLWPLPTGTIDLGKELQYIDYSDINVIISSESGTKAYLEMVVQYFRSIISDNYVNCKTQTKKMTIYLNARSSNTNLGWDTDESYEVLIENNVLNVIVTITGETVFGVRHGLETLLQLMTVVTQDESSCLVTINSAHITDEPAYTHRGLLIDSARNYLSIPVIKKHIDALAMSKMNFLHWHITDSQSFPFVSKSLANMTKFGSYSAKEVYTPAEILELIGYAKIRGVRIIMEIDGPAHAGNGWQWGPEAGLGNLAVCINQQPWRTYCIQPPCGQLNPANPRVYEVLQTLYKDIVDLDTTLKVFHMGGDEVFINCWNTTQEIIDYIPNRNDLAFLNLWGEFQEKALNAFDAARESKNTTMILWTSHLTDPNFIQKYLSKDRYVIQTWVPSTDDLPQQLLNLGYKIIISTKDRWYLDHGFWGSTVYSNWRKVYENKILSGNGVLGGELCMWGELVDDNNVIQRTWPRTAAGAERLWTNSNLTSRQVENRFFMFVKKLNSRGVRAEVPVPKWCSQNEGECDTYLPY